MAFMLFIHASSVALGMEISVGQPVIAWIAIHLCTDIHGQQKMKPNDFDDSPPPVDNFLF